MPGSEVARQAAADAVYYVTLNLIGFYVRYVGEINMRRGFLDKRGCIETTFKLKYEKEQEVLLLITFSRKQYTSSSTRDDRGFRCAGARTFGVASAEGR